MAHTLHNSSRGNKNSAEQIDANPYVSKRGLRKKLLAKFLMVALIPMLVVVYASYTTAKASLHNAAETTLTTHVKNTVAFLGNWFEYRILDLETIASSGNTIDFLAKLQHSHNNSDLELSEFVKSYQWNEIAYQYSSDLINYQRSYGYYDVKFIDLNGDILYSNKQQSDLGTNLRSGPYSETLFSSAFSVALESGATTFSDIESYKPSNDNTSGFLCTVILNNDGDKIGVLAFQLSPQQLEYATGVLHSDNLEIQSYMIGLNRTNDGVSIRNSIDKHNQSQPAPEIAIDNPQTRLWFNEHGPLGTQIRKNEDILIYENQGRVLGTHADLHIADIHWGVIAEISEDIAFASSNKLWKNMIWIIATTGVIVILIAKRTTRRVVQPITDLSDNAIRVANGDLDHTCAVSSSDEIGGLAESFNSMVQSLRMSFADLNNQKYALDQHAIVSITDIRGNITYVNDKFVELSGYSREELIGQSHRMVKSDEHDLKFYQNLWKTIASKNVWTGEIKNLAKNGTPYWVRATIVPFKNGEGKITHYVAIRTDITAMKESESLVMIANDSLTDQRNELFSLTQDLEITRRDAENANKAKSDFLANMSHEIRTPMTAILGFADTIIDDNETSEVPNSNLDAVDTIKRNGEHLLTIINDILDISKIEAGKVEIESIRFSLIELVSDVNKLMMIRANEKSLALELEFNGTLPEYIESDPTRLRQILVNIVGNAIKFTDSGSVKIVTSYIQDQPGTPLIQFDVIDTGIGITEEQIGQLFKAFAQADTSTTRKFGGTGLGLDISKRFAEMMGGSIKVISSYGQGSTFRITISSPCLDGVKLLEDPNLILQSSNRQIKKGKEQLKNLNCRILLAEDGPDNQRLITFILKKAGATVVVCENGKLALDSALESKSKGAPFDVILMDMQMPVMSGYEASSALRSAGYTNPIIALTAHAMASDRKKCIDAGCDDFATKPIDKAKLIKLIDFYANQSASAA